MNETVLPDRQLVAQSWCEQGKQAVDIKVFEELASTSRWLRENICELETPSLDCPPCLCITDWQMAGIARRGKSWQTRPGNITFSLYRSSARKPQDLLGLSLVTGIAIARTLSEVLCVDVMLKWPNDVIHDNAKLGGLLTEIIKPADQAARSQSPGFSVSQTASQQNAGFPRSEIITGVGINVLHDAQVLALGLGATSLETAGVPLDRPARDALIGSLARSVFHHHHVFEQQGWAVFENQWKQLDWLRDKEIHVHGQSGVEHGVARGVSDSGALKVEFESGTRLLFGGDVSVRPSI